MAMHLPAHAGKSFLAAPRGSLWLAIKTTSLLLELSCLVVFDVAIWLLLKGHVQAAASNKGCWRHADGIGGKLVRVCMRGRDDVPVRRARVALIEAMA
jgi:hypothetical protein